MDIEVVLVFGVPVVAFALSVGLSYWMGRARSTLGLSGISVVWLVFTAAMLFGLDQATGWDGLGYIGALLGISAPVAFGAPIGGIIGLTKKDDVVHA